MLFSDAVQLCCSAQALAHDLAELAGFEHVASKLNVFLQTVGPR